MTDEQRKRIHAITYSTDDRAELAERIVRLEDERDKLKNNNNYLHEALSESRQANEHLHTELKRHKSILRTRPNAMTALYDENARLRRLLSGALISAGTEGRQFFDAYLQEEEGVTLLQELRSLGIEVDA